MDMFIYLPSHGNLPPIAGQWMWSFLFEGVAALELVKCSWARVLLLSNGVCPNRIMCIHSREGVVAAQATITGYIIQLRP